jgi:imidazolonepropionase-like amidohydrolase
MSIDPYAGLIINWPRSRPVNAWWMEQSESEQRNDIRSSTDAIDAVFDTAEAYVAARDADASQPVDIRWEAMRDVLPGGADQRPVFIFASDFDQITSAVTWAIERGLKPVIVGARDADLAAKLLVKHHVPFILSGIHNFPKRADLPFDHAFTLPQRLEAAGVQWALASGEETAHERSLPYNAAKAVSYGLDPDVAIRSITLSAAEILGIADDYGHLAEGASATLIITDGTPLEIMTHVERAFIDGREIDLTNKQSVLRDKYVEKYRQLDMIDDQ